MIPAPKRKWDVAVRLPTYWHSHLEVEAETEEEAEHRAENIFFRRGINGFTWNKDTAPDTSGVEFSADHAEEGDG